jgi:TonB family protein
VTAPGDILLEHERMGRWFFAALALHVVVIGGVFLANWVQGHTETFGAKDAGGAAVGIQAVNAIPLQTHGPENRLATDTDSEVPQTPAKPVQRAKKEIPAPNAVPLKMKTPKRKLADVASEQSHVTKFNKLDPYQLTSKTAPALSSPEFAVTGSGRISPGAHNTFGEQFSAYGAQIQQLVASHWHTDTVDQSIRSAPTVIATFDLSRDGSVHNLHILQSSNIPPLDASVQRAILDSSPLPALPPGFPHNTASVEFWFELKR